MKLFLSTYINKVDKNGRVSVPAQFRSALKDQEFFGVVAYLSFTHKCIEACSMNRMEEISESIDSMEIFSEERDAFAIALLGGSQQLQFDTDGRVTLCPSLLSKVGISNKAAFVGKGVTFEIWNPDDLNVCINKSREIARDNRSLLRTRNKVIKND